ncbi:MAG: beta-ketoacyl-[acyl-carrier-protein] synthase II [Lachnospiraceae bacterium]|nr:beta-ketoacyl-[acyl-carrier-protein] synthase II [Lachnospiraceae bacterium]
MRRVVITGMGAVTPIGNSVSDTWESIKAGKCGIDKITHYDVSNRKVKVAGEVKNLNFEDYIDKKELRKMDKFCAFALIAAREAVEDSGIKFETDSDRCGVIVSSGIGGLGTIEVEYSKGSEKGFDRISPYFIPASISNMAAGRIAIEHGIHGMCNSVVTACAGGTNAVGDSFRYIKDGYAEVMLCGGTESSITESGIGGFTSLKALSQSEDPMRASIPFDKERNGFVMGEGAGILVLEELEHALARNAKIYGEVVGYGANCDAYHITAPLEDGSGAAKCMQLAMKEAGIEASKISYINAHGTSTPMNDKGETRAVKLAFVDASNSVMMSSTKSMTGHLLGASGAIEAIITTLAVKEGFVPATINYSVPDEECDLDIVANEGRNVEIEYAMSNSLGFGGHNASIIVKKYQ